MRSVVAGVAAILLGIGFSGTALAAPQVLGLTASNGPIPFSCNDDDCTALAGTFCLQRERSLPVWGAPYVASHPHRLTLAFLTRDGRIARSAGGPWVRFTAYNGYTMVHMTVPRSLLAVHDATAVALEIGPGISLVPTPQPGDTDPQSIDEIAFATGPMRIAAARYLDGPSAGIDAARLLTALVGALPERRTIHDDYGDVWRNTITAGMTEVSGPAALSSARDAYDRCRGQPEIRHCLMSRHRELMQRDNTRYWEESAGY
jgi:hypothetical protein